MSITTTANITSFPQTGAIPEDSTRIYYATLRDALGVPIVNPADVTAILVTLTDVKTNTVINGRTGQSVRNINGGTLAANGLFTLTLAPADNPMVSTDLSLKFEQHRLCFHVTSVGGSELHEVYFYVQRMSCA